MLRSLRDLESYRIQAADGRVGGVKDLLFDDATWRVRYMVAGSGERLSGRKVLLPTSGFGTPQWRNRVFPVSGTREQVRRSPGLDTDPPVSRQHELDLHRHYRWLPYWSTAPSKDAGSARRDPSLRSVKQILGYSVDSPDGTVGQIVDLIADDTDWTIRYVVVDTGKFLQEGDVLAPPGWFDAFDWTSRTTQATASKGTIKACPKYVSSELISRDMEERFYGFYGLPRYWAR